MARHFNGTFSDKVTSTTTLQATAPTAYTWAAWVNGDGAPNSVSTRSPFLLQAVNGNNCDDGFSWDDATTNRSVLHEYGFNQRTNLQVGAALSGSTWYHLAAIWTPGTLTVYLNGVSSASTGTNVGTLEWLAAPSFYLSTNPRFVTYWPGSVADAAVWSIALTTGNIASLASGQRADHVQPSNLMVYWPILGQSPEPDKSGNANHGVVAGTTVVADPPLLEQWLANYTLLGLPSSSVVPIITIQQW